MHANSVYFKNIKKHQRIYTICISSKDCFLHHLASPVSQFCIQFFLSSVQSVQMLSRVRLFATPWTLAHQAPLSMELSRQEYWSVLVSSVAQSCPALQSHGLQYIRPLCPSPPCHHQLPEFTQTHVHGVGDAIQPSHPLSSPSPPAPNPSQHQSLFQ